MMNEQLDRIEKNIKIIFKMLEMLGIRQLTKEEIEKEKKRKKEREEEPYIIQWKYGNDEPYVTTRTERVIIISGDYPNNPNPYEHMVTNGGNAPWDRRLTNWLYCPKCGTKDISSDTGNNYVCHRCQYNW